MYSVLTKVLCLYICFMISYLLVESRETSVGALLWMLIASSWLINTFLRTYYL